MAKTTRKASVKATRQQTSEDFEIVTDLIPSGNSNRPGTPLHASKITIHNTDNDDPGANAQAHCSYQKGADARRRQVSWHFSVDDHCVYQSLPLDEVGWHSGRGNSRSVAIEICQNRGIDQAAANDRAARLTALLLHQLGIDLDGNVVQHHDWTGKDCPHLLRHPPNGWTIFLEMVSRYYAAPGEAQREDDHMPTDLVAVAPADDDKRNDFRGTRLVQTNIVSTEFGGGSEVGMPSAYSGIIDPNQPQAALPARVPQSRMKILVTNRANGKSVVCRVNDVGPWNEHDAYWDHGNRPAAEAQHRDHQVAEDHRVPSNEAGLDLTPAAMLALGVSGAVNTRQVTVNWQFA